jgi:hypothetical protein
VHPACPVFDQPARLIAALQRDGLEKRGGRRVDDIERVAIGIGGDREAAGLKPEQRAA